MNGAAVLSGDVLINTNRSSSTNDGSVIFTGTILSDDSASGRKLAIDAGDNSINVAGAIGSRSEEHTSELQSH